MEYELEDEARPDIPVALMVLGRSHALSGCLEQETRSLILSYRYTVNSRKSDGAKIQGRRGYGVVLHVKLLPSSSFDTML
jgi:hypothetical protein